MSYLFRKKNLHQVVIEMSIEELDNYVLKMEEYLENEVDNFQKDFEERTKGWDEQEKDEYGEYLSDEYWTLAETHPHFLRNSMFINIYSFFEKELKDLCRFYKKRTKTNSISYPNKVSKIAKALQCLEHCFKINLSEEIEEWKKIDGIYREIRNIIAHDGGEIEKDRLDEVTILLKDMPVEIKKSTGELQPHKELCLSFLKDITSFFNQLFELINENNNKGFNREEVNS